MERLNIPEIERGWPKWCYNDDGTLNDDGRAFVEAWTSDPENDLPDGCFNAYVGRHVVGGVTILTRQSESPHPSSQNPDQDA